MARIAVLCRDLDRLAAYCGSIDLGSDAAWDRLFRFAEKELGIEAQEFLVTVLLEPYGDLVDGLSETMAGDEETEFWIDGAQTLAELGAQIDQTYSFASDTDFRSPAAQARFWYVSEEKLEPRLGERASEDGSGREQPLAVARDAVKLRTLLKTCSGDETVASLLVRRPDVRHTVRRVQLAARHPYAEIRDNLVSAAMRPIDILRCKLSFFGATDFDPRSDRWVRISLYRHAPFPDELFDVAPDDWAIPPTETARLERASVARDVGPAAAQVACEAKAGYSLNEIDAEIRKAARGAGLSWGAAEEAGKAARLMASVDACSLAGLAACFERHEAGRLSESIAVDGRNMRSPDERPLSPLILGPAVGDHIRTLGMGMLEIDSPIDLPVLLMPYLALLAGRMGRAILFESPSCDVAVTRAELPRMFAMLATCNQLKSARLTLAGAGPTANSAKPDMKSGVAIPHAVWSRLDRLAALTYVPATDTSRLLGAGAGLSDND